MAHYPPPLDALLTLGEPERGAEWPDYQARGIGPEHVPGLIRMASDPELNRLEPDNPAVWAPLHAWRALGKSKSEEAVGPLVDLLRPLEDDDYDGSAMEEVPDVLGMIGPAALPALEAALFEEVRGRYGLVAVSEAIKEVGTRHPEARDRCVAILTRKLEGAEQNEPDLNGFITGELIHLGAVESAPVIERAFAADRVDPTIAGDWHDVFVALGLEGPPPPSTNWRQRFREQLGLSANLHGSAPGMVSRGPAADHRKERNKARKKMEKQARQQRRKRGR